MANWVQYNKMLGEAFSHFTDSVNRTEVTIDKKKKCITVEILLDDNESSDSSDNGVKQE